MLVGKSDQLDNIDLLSGPRDFTITGASKGPDDQPLNITLAEYPRPWRPGLTMRRVLAAMWGPEADEYIGRKVRLYRDPEVRFGSDKTGGTRISHASHLDKRLTVSLPTSKGKFGAFTVDPLPDEAPTKSKAAESAEPSADVATITDRDVLTRMWKAAPRDSAERAAIEARVAELNTNPAPADDGPSDADWDAMGARAGDLA